MNPGTRPWDKRLAARVVQPLARLRVSPNAITVISLALGVTAAWGFAVDAAALGGSLFIVAAFADHADGELARMTGKTSRVGHYLDRLVASVNYTAVFIGMGLGAGTDWGLYAGLVSGASVAGIFAIRNYGARAKGKVFMDQSARGGFETEDVMYIIGPIGWLGWHPWFVAIAAVGAPVYFAVTLVRLLRR